MPAQLNTGVAHHGPKTAVLPKIKPLAAHPETEYLAAIFVKIMLGSGLAGTATHVNNFCLRGKIDTPSNLFCLQAEIGLLIIEKIPFIEQPSASASTFRTV